MAADIQSKFDVDSELVKGDAGVFDVVMDGKLLFSKHEVGRFPEPEEILSAIEEQLSGS